MASVLSDAEQQELRLQLARAVGAQVIPAPEADRLFQACVQGQVTQKDLMILRKVLANSTTLTPTMFKIENVDTVAEAKRLAILAIMDVEKSIDEAIMREIVWLIPATYFFQKWNLERTTYKNSVTKLQYAKSWFISAQNNNIVAPYLRAISDALDAKRILDVEILKRSSAEEWISKTQGWLRDNIRKGASSAVKAAESGVKAVRTGALKVGAASLAAFLLWNQFKKGN